MDLLGLCDPNLFEKIILDSCINGDPSFAHEDF